MDYLKPEFLVVSNENQLLKPFFHIDDENNGQAKRVPFAVTSDGIYLYVPLDVNGRNKRTLVQNVIKSKHILSEKFWKAWDKKAFADYEYLRDTRNAILMKPKEPRQINLDFPKYVIIVHFKADGKDRQKQEEIIEVALVLLDLETGELKKEFHECYSSRLHRKLPDSYSQPIGTSVMDSADCFPELYKKAEKWIIDLGSYHKNCVMGAETEEAISKFLRIQCIHYGISLPKITQTWVNISNILKQHHCLEKNLKLQEMLFVLNIEFKRKTSSGLDEARCLAKVAYQLRLDHCRFKVNQCLSDSAPWFCDIP